MKKISKWLRGSGVRMLAIIIALNIGIAFIASNSDFKMIDGTYAASTPKSAPQPELSIKQHICEATNGENCDVIYNLCMAESNCERWAVNHNTNGTFDYSYFQINDVHIIGKSKKGTITMDCVHDLYCAARWVNEKVKAGQLHIWVAANKI